MATMQRQESQGINIHSGSEHGLPEQITLRDRVFTKPELETIAKLIELHFTEGRTSISVAICKHLEWRQPNGWLKDRACRDVLIRLEKLGFIKLPDRKTKGYPYSLPRAIQSDQPSSPDTNLKPISQDPGAIVLELAKGNPSEQIWNQLVNSYHYRGYKVAVGRCLKYLIKSSSEVLGAICFSSAAWQLAPRDQLLVNIINVADLHDYVINNSRFLILPNVRVSNLASRILSIATKQVVIDWEGYYSVTPQVVETFVEPDRFLGTCYKAANWIEIGTTKGYAKRGSDHHNSQQPKQIFLYGLNKSMRRKLRKAVSDKGMTDE
jgi:hypothetical protein